MNWSCVDYLALCFQKALTQCFDCKGLLEISWRDTKLWPAWSGSTDPAQQLPPWARRWVAEYFCNHIHNLQGLSRPSMMLCQEQDVVRACTDYLVSASGDFVRQTGDTVYWPWAGHCQTLPPPIWRLATLPHIHFVSFTANLGQYSVYPLFY